MQIATRRINRGVPPETTASSVLAMVALLVLAGCAETASTADGRGVADTGGRDVGTDVRPGFDATGETSTSDPDADLPDSTVADAGIDAAPSDPDAIDSDVALPDTGPTADVGPDGAVVPDPPPGPIRGGALGVEPASVFFSYIGGVGSVEDLVLIRNVGDAPVSVSSITMDAMDSGFSVYGAPPSAYVIPPGDFLEFGVRYRPDTSGGGSSQVRIEHELPTSPLIVPVSASEKDRQPPPPEPPCVRVRPVILDFGTVPRGTPVPAARTFDIQNCGTSDVRITRLDRGAVFFFPTPASFQWAARSPLPLTIPAGGSHTVDVTFTAGRAGAQNGRIDVRTNVPGSETVGVTLRAESQPPPLEDLDLHIVLRWDQSGGSDVDMHFLRPGASMNTSPGDCYYANLTPDWGVAGSILDDPFLDYDDLQGPGPENLNLQQAAPGLYRLIVYYYSDTGSGGSGGGGSSVSTNARIEIRQRGVLTHSFGPVRLARTGATWDVATIEYPGGVVTEVGTVR